MELPIIHQEIWKSESGMMCLARRYSMRKQLNWQWWCGYVVIPHDHPLYGISDCWCPYEFDTGHDPSCRSCFLTHVLVHGGITFTGFIGEDWCVGFDMNHDLDRDKDWNLDDCKAETERLAKQIAAAHSL